ncbi:MAG: tetraacyldisaccharide 4'-kinase [Phycisphaerae bacterium]
MIPAMDEQRVRDIMSGRARGIGPALLRGGLGMAAVPYALAMRLRRRLYARGVLPSRSADIPVICVGNLTTGGTGKTPMVAAIVQMLRNAGANPAVLTRGYKAADGVSDEAELLRDLTGAKVIVNADRAAGAAQAMADGADVAVMDDGFQHLRLARDLDMVLLDATNPWGYGHCLPRGMLREPPAALRAADAVVITRIDQVAEQQVDAIGRRVREIAPDVPIACARHQPLALLDETGQPRPMTDLAGRKVCAFCGIGNPGAFFAMLEQHNARLVSRHALPDHADYARALDRALCGTCEPTDGCPAQIMVTTEKDFVKLSETTPFRRKVWRVRVEMAITQGAEQIERLVRNALRR